MSTFVGNTSDNEHFSGKYEGFHHHPHSLCPDSAVAATAVRLW